MVRMSNPYECILLRSVCVQHPPADRISGHPAIAAAAAAAAAAVAAVAATPHAATRRRCCHDTRRHAPPPQPPAAACPAPRPERTTATTRPPTVPDLPLANTRPRQTLPPEGRPEQTFPGPTHAKIQHTARGLLAAAGANLEWPGPWLPPEQETPAATPANPPGEKRRTPWVAEEALPATRRPTQRRRE